MYMNIYITQDNAVFLHGIKDKQSMSSLVNNLLDKYRAEGKELLKNPIPVSTNPILENARGNTNNGQIDNVIKTPEDAKKAVKEITYKKTGNWGA